MAPRIRWRGGDAELRAALTAVLEGSAEIRATLLRVRSPRRRHLRVWSGSGRSLFVKHWTRSDPGQAWGLRLGWGTARREWRALRRLQAAGVPVARPLALGWLPTGEAVLASAWREGLPLPGALHACAKERRLRLAEIGALLARLHAAGAVHGDLHAGNLLWTDAGPVLLDLQALRWTRRRDLRLRDLADLDRSLAGILSRPDRVRLQAATLGLSRPFGPAARAALRAVARGSRSRDRAHARSRTRRMLRPGRRVARIRRGRRQGLRLRDVPERLLDRALAAHQERTPLPSGARRAVSAVRADGRAVIVKECRAGPARRLADRLRGSPARRAWRGGHGLLARGIGAATPLAFLEERRLGLPARSWLLLEDLRPLQPADRLAGDPARAEAVADALSGLAIDLHRAGVVHGDLKASHVFLGGEGGRAKARLCDLDGVRFPRRLRETERIQALVELNASLPDALPADLRRRAFERYAAALPFASPGRALARIVEESLAREHRWTGADCPGTRRSMAVCRLRPLRR